MEIPWRAPLGKRQAARDSADFAPLAANGVAKLGSARE
jgi:hypothetical protein